MSSTSAVFIGDASLLVRCAQAWLEAGHTVRAVASSNAEVLRWAQANAIDSRRIEAGTQDWLPEGAFDYLFSVANLRVLPEAVIRRAGKVAINFHDGPLPRYAGLNATSWALMHREPTHGITWHEMTPGVDQGRIVRQALFDVAPHETAIGLNARCYEAGLAAFVQIAADIAHGELALAPQSGDRSYFPRDRRPDALGTLDFARTADELAAVVRALDFGSYPNPLGRPKVWTGTDIVLVKSAAIAAVSTAAAPGTVMHVDGDTVQVATASGVIALAGCTTVDGAPASSLLRAGMALPLMPQTARIHLASQTPRVARGEVHWTQAFNQLSPVALPYPRAEITGTRTVTRVPLGLPPRSARTVAGFLSWLACVAAQGRVSVMYSDAELAAGASGLESWLTPWVPLSIEVSPQGQTVDVVRAAEAAVAACRNAGPCTRDLPLRLGDATASLVQAQRIGVALHAVTQPGRFDLLLAVDAVTHQLELVANDAAYPAVVQCMATQLASWLAVFDQPQPRTLASLPLLPEAEVRSIERINATQLPVAAGCVHEAIASRALASPEALAIEHHGQAWTFAQLESRVVELATALLQRGVKPGDVVGLCLPRTPDLVASAIAIMRTGAAYLPLDPDYPADRIAFMVEDSGTRVVMADGANAARLRFDIEHVLDVPAVVAAAGQERGPAVDPESAAYMIYTSGSTGKPKGVVVTHRNAMNFFAGMDERIPHGEDSRWLAVTSLSFDISVLELFWTLSRGVTVVLHSNAPASDMPHRAALDFSLFYFASDHASSAQDRYRLLLEGAKFADRNGFAAVWTPERHFHAFGGLYPNPAVTSAAIAAVTSRIQIRAGSCVLPLHHPIRVAEEWAFVDNISNGRVGISFASGWQPNDFVIAPQAFANRKQDMIDNIDVVRRLWRGDTVAFPGPHGKDVAVRTLPRPVQPELPVWLTAAGNPETFEQAGTLGCHLLTHLLGQKIEDVTHKIALYRAAWRKAGHAGEGRVTLMLHTFIGDDDEEVRETVRGPMKDYLRSSVDLIRQAAWSFPTFVQRAAADGKSPVEIMEAAPLAPDEMDALLEHAFARYYETSALFGTQKRCLPLLQQFQSAGVDEIACLVDFGIAPDRVLAHLEHLKALMDASRGLRTEARRISVGEQVVQRGVTHLQCTPSMASMLVADSDGRDALARLQVLMVGGEALPLELARELRRLVPGRVLNMYGPTETTIWSTTCDLAAIGDFVPLGEPIANTQLSLRNAWDMECPALVAGELLVGGAGVARGYWRRPELDAERFAKRAGQRWYRTGDLVRRHADGRLEFLGRIDHQVKIRGHRVELGEIENALAQQAGVQQAVVVARPDAAGEQRLVAYVTTQPGAQASGPALRDALAQSLPEVMLPHSVQVVPAFPLTPNGKIDRKALPDPNAPLAVRTQATPQGQLENTIAAIWQDVLGLPQVGTTENFFDLGGHSLLVVQVQRRLREACGREVSITDMFRLPTIRALAAHLGGDESAAPSAVDDGLSRANARRQMRARVASNSNNAVRA